MFVDILWKTSVSYHIIYPAYWNGINIFFLSQVFSQKFTVTLQMNWICRKPCVSSQVNAKRSFASIVMAVEIGL